MSQPRAAIDDFVQQKRLAVVGVSHTGKRFGAIAYKTLKQLGYELTPVHPAADTIMGDRAAKSLATLPHPVDGVVVIVPPQQSAAVVREAAQAGISRVWLQQGAESDEAIAVAEQSGLSVVHHQCVLMFANNTGFPHSTHRFILKLFGRLPH